MTSKKSKKIQKYKIVKKQVKTITIPYKKYGTTKKASGHYRFAIIYEPDENKIIVMAGDNTLQKLIKFSSKAYYIYNGEKIDSGDWVKSKYPTDTHYYIYNGNHKLYITIRYTAYTYKKI